MCNLHWYYTCTVLSQSESSNFFHVYYYECVLYSAAKVKISKVHASRVAKPLGAFHCIVSVHCRVVPKICSRQGKFWKVASELPLSAKGAPLGVSRGMPPGNFEIVGPQKWHSQILCISVTVSSFYSAKISLSNVLLSYFFSLWLPLPFPPPRCVCVCV